MGNKESVRVKVSKNAKGEIIRIKPEYEDLKRLGGEDQETAAGTLRHGSFADSRNVF